MEFVVFIPFIDSLQEPRGLHQRPLIDFGKSIKRERILNGRKIGNIAQDKSRRIAKLSIGVGESVQHLPGDSDVLLKVAGSNPKTQDFSAARFDNGLRFDDISQRLRHRLSFRIQRPAMC